MNRLIAIPGIEERRSRWQDSEAFCYRGKEVLHFDDANIVDLRLGRKTIKAHQDDELNDPRVTVRGQSDWVNIRVASSEDVEFVVGLVRDILVE
ncbi:MAG: DUF5519 family protein [Actinobacteria bacterium]|nr:DUF5519 family protein [Actinomycetota bacterium]